jgi:Toastrack DUF4097
MVSSLAMTRPRRVALAIGAPLALLFFGAAGLNVVSWTAQASYHVDFTARTRGHTASVTVGAGQIALRPGTAGVHVTGTAHYAFSRPRVSWRDTASGVIVDSRCRVINKIAGHCAFDYTIALPPGVGANITDRAGNVAAQGLTVPLTLRSNAGDIGLWSLSGDVQARTQAGEINGRGLSGTTLTAVSGAGDIRLAGVTSPQVTVNNRAGDITVAFARAPGQVRITDSAGNVRLVLPPGNTSYDIHTAAPAGRVSVAASVPVSSRSSHVIFVTDHAGNITVTE